MIYKTFILCFYLTLTIQIFPLKIDGRDAIKS